MLGFHIPAAPPLYTNTFLLISDAGHAVVIDPAADAQTYDKILKENNAQLTTILCTHGHYDHVGSAEVLRTEWNAKLYCEVADLAGDRMYPLSAADCGYAEGETVSVDELQFTVWHTPGHTPGGVVLLCGEYLFCGDTLFSGGCGRLFEGTPAQMLESLDRLAVLPASTLVCCAHEYTLSNLRFAQAAEPGNAELAHYLQQCEALRAKGKPTVPSTIGRELQINPFLRVREPALQQAAQAQGAASTGPVDTLAALREWKNTF